MLAGSLPCRCLSVSLVLLALQPAMTFGRGPCSELMAEAFPPGLGGVFSAAVDSEAARRWRTYREAREEERFEEALDPDAVRARYRAVDQSAIKAGCVSIPQLVDVGRALFLRNFTPAEGLGVARIKPESAATSGKLRQISIPPPSGRSLSCSDCHWRGGIAGAGDRVDNVHRGAGDVLDAGEVLHPPALWGAGWIERIADELGQDLREQRQRLIIRARASGQTERAALVSQGIDFGELVVEPGPRSGTPRVDSSGLQGIDEDLTIRPFGWRGRYATIRDTVAAQLQLHLGLQATELVESRVTVSDLSWIDVGKRGLLHRRDPDRDGVREEITEGQLSALVAFIATLDTPFTGIPEQGPVRGEIMTAELVMRPTDELAHRWAKGAAVFDQIGCGGCHVPFLEVTDPRLRLGPVDNDDVPVIDLATNAAMPRPGAENGKWLVPVFSDFRRHRMGAHLARPNAADGGANDDVYFTRPLWGLASTRPYLHDGSASTLEQAIAMHGGEGSDATPATEAYASLDPDAQSALHVYLLSLQRAASIRIR